MVQNTNCVSTALHRTRCIGQDRSIDASLFPTCIEPMLRRLDVPREGCLIGFYLNNDPDNLEHLGVVESTNPPLITHRPYHDADIEERIPLEDVLALYPSANSLKYFEPSTLHLEEWLFD